MNKVEVDWNFYKGGNSKKSKEAYSDFWILLSKNNHKLLSEYANAKTKILIDFKCGHDAHWITPDNYKKGVGCPKCNVRTKEDAERDFMKSIDKSGYRLLSKYINAHTKVLIDFNCGHKPNWITPNNYNGGVRCGYCCGKGGQAEKDFIDILNKNNHKLLSEYINNRTKVLIDFNCGHKPSWMTPNGYKKGNRCIKCAGSCPEQAKEDFISMMLENNHKLLSEYVDNNTKVLIDFNCGHEPYWIRPSGYKRGNGCPLCKNKGESMLYKLILDMGCRVESQKKYNDLKDKLPLSYDFYLPEHNLLIELDGEHHYKPMPYITKNMTDSEKDMAELDALISFEDRQRKDKIKDEYAKKNNISLLRIDYSDSKIDTEKWRKLILEKIEEIKTSTDI